MRRAEHTNTYTKMTIYACDLGYCIQNQTFYKIQYCISYSYSLLQSITIRKFNAPMYATSHLELAFTNELIIFGTKIELSLAFESQIVQINYFGCHSWIKTINSIYDFQTCPRRHISCTRRHTKKFCTKRTDSGEI